MRFRLSPDHLYLHEKLSSMLLPCPARDSTGKCVHKPFSFGRHSVIFCTKETWKVVRNAFDTPARRLSITNRNDTPPFLPISCKNVSDERPAPGACESQV